jgi:hypothetical protein
MEFVVVLVGLTLALFFVDWREDRSDESVALQEILADLEADSVELAIQFRNSRRSEEAVLWVLRNRDSELPGDSIFTRTQILNYGTSYELVNAGYHGLRETGRLGIIRDWELRRQLVYYFEVTQPYMMWFHESYMKAYWEFGAAQAPYVRIVPDETGDVLNQGFSFQYVRPWREANADHVYIRSIELMGTTASQFGIRLETTLASNAELRAALRDALE